MVKSPPHPNLYLHVLRGSGYPYAKNLTTCVREGIHINAPLRLHLDQNSVTMLREIQEIRQQIINCFGEELFRKFVEGSKIRIWGVANWYPPFHMGYLVIFARYRERWHVDFMGVTSDERCCPSLARRLMGSARWKNMFLIRRIILNKRERRAIEGFLDAYWHRFLQDPLERWPASEEIPLDKFLDRLKEESAVQKIKKAVSSVLGGDIE